MARKNDFHKTNNPNELKQGLDIADKTVQSVTKEKSEEQRPSQRNGHGVAEALNDYSAGTK